MYGYDPIQIAAMALAALVASVIVLALLRSFRRSSSSRRRQNRLSNAFDRASYVRRHGSVPVGSQYGIYEDGVRSVSSMR
jgi:hypothetical protein